MSKFHFKSAVEELIEAISHLAFYSGWPNAVTAITLVKEVFQQIMTPVRRRGSVFGEV